MNGGFAPFCNTCGNYVNNIAAIAKLEEVHV